MILFEGYYNELLCAKYQEITSPYADLKDKIKAIRQQAPELYDAVINIGKGKKLFDMHEEVKNYLS